MGSTAFVAGLGEARVRVIAGAFGADHEGPLDILRQTVATELDTVRSMPAEESGSPLATAAVKSLAMAEHKPSPPDHLREAYQLMMHSNAMNAHGRAPADWVIASRLSRFARSELERIAVVMAGTLDPDFFGPMWALYVQEGGPSEATHKFVIDPSLQRITINLSLHSELSKKLQTWFAASAVNRKRFEEGACVYDMNQYDKLCAVAHFSDPKMLEKVESVRVLDIGSVERLDDAMEFQGEFAFMRFFSGRNKAGGVQSRWGRHRKVGLGNALPIYDRGLR
jgi:hypothetical protein